MRQILLILTAIIIMVCMTCCDTERIETIEKDGETISETATKEFKLEPLQETIQPTTEEVEEFMNFSYTILSENENTVGAVYLRFEGKKTFSTMCTNLEDVKTVLESVPCEVFLVDNQGTEIHMNKSQIVAVLGETFSGR